MTTYLLKFSACLMIFWLIYVLLLEAQKMHRFKRFYLLGSIVLAFIIPTLTITEYVEPIPTTNILDDYNLYTTEAIPFQDIPLVTVVEPTNYGLIILWCVYGLGVFIFLARFITNLFKLYRKISKSERIKNQPFIYVLLKHYRIPHSFFKYIFLNASKYHANEIPKEVILHEQTHAKQWHSLDILLLEIFQIVFWFHPLVYIIKHHVKLNHEFLADEAVLNQGVTAKTYQHILLQFSSPENFRNTQNHQLTSAINYSSIKKRFTVMKTQTSKPRIWLSSLLLLPICAILFYSFAEREYVEKEILELSNINKPAQVLVNGINCEKCTFSKQDISDLKLTTTSEMEIVEFTISLFTLKPITVNGNILTSRLKEFIKNDKALYPIKITNIKSRNGVLNKTVLMFLEKQKSPPSVSEIEAYSIWVKQFKLSAKKVVYENKETDLLYISAKDFNRYKSIFARMTETQLKSVEPFPKTIIDSSSQVDNDLRKRAEENYYTKQFFTIKNKSGEVVKKRFNELDYEDKIKWVHADEIPYTKIDVTESHFKEAKKSKDYIIKVNGNYISREDLNKYKASDFITFSYRSIPEIAKMKEKSVLNLVTHDIYEFFIELMSNQYAEAIKAYEYELNLPEDQREKGIKELVSIYEFLNYNYSRFTPNIITQNNFKAPTPIPQETIDLVNNSYLNIPILFVDKTNNLFLNNKPTSLETIKKDFNTITKSEKSELILEADGERVNYNFVKKIMEAIGDNLLNISVSNEQALIYNPDFKSENQEQQKPPTEKEVASYNAWAKKVHAERKKLSANATWYPPINEEDFKKYAAIYKRMTDTQRKDAQSFPDALPPPPKSHHGNDKRKKGKLKYQVAAVSSVNSNNYELDIPTLERQTSQSKHIFTHFSDQSHNTIQPIEIEIKSNKTIILNGQKIQLDALKMEVQKLNSHLSNEDHRKYVTSSILIAHSELYDFAKSIQNDLARVNVWSSIIQDLSKKTKLGTETTHLKLYAGLTLDEANEKEKEIKAYTTKTSTKGNNATSNPWKISTGVTAVEYIDSENNTYNLGVPDTEPTNTKTSSTTTTPDEPEDYTIRKLILRASKKQSQPLNYMLNGKKSNITSLEHFIKSHPQCNVEYTTGKTENTLSFSNKEGDKMTLNDLQALYSSLFKTYIKEPTKIIVQPVNTKHKGGPNPSAFHNKVLEDSETKKAYINKYAAYETMRYTKPHFIKKSKTDKKKMSDLWVELRQIYFYSLSNDEKSDLKLPITPFAPYVKINLNGKSYYKVNKYLTDEEYKASTIFSQERQKDFQGLDLLDKNDPIVIPLRNYKLEQPTVTHSDKRRRVFISISEEGTLKMSKDQSLKNFEIISLKTLESLILKLTEEEKANTYIFTSPKDYKTYRSQPSNTPEYQDDIEVVLIKDNVKFNVMEYEGRFTEHPIYQLVLSNKTSSRLKDLVAQLGQLFKKHGINNLSL